MHTYFCIVVCVFLCAALVMLLFQALLSVLKVKTAPRLLCIHWNTEGENKTQRENWKDDDKCSGIYLEWSSFVGITMVQIAMTSIHSLSVASANIRSPQQPRAFKKHPVFFSLVTSTLLPPSPLIAFPPLQPSSAPICPSLQNVMRQAENGSGVLRGRALLLTGGILLIKKKKKALLSVQEGFLPCGMCTG